MWKEERAGWERQGAREAGAGSICLAESGQTDGLWFAVLRCLLRSRKERVVV